ncbi:MAG: hypothetical protein ACI9H6_000075 [Patiriisocius sp.]|jgi:hypothetical protein
MTKVLHEGTTIQQSIAWISFHNIVQSKLINEDDEKLKVYADLCWREAVETRESLISSSERCFHKTVTFGGEWAVDILPLVPKVFPKTRTRLHAFVVDSWLHTQDKDLESRLAQILYNTQRDEYDAVSGVIRKTLESRLGNPSLDKKPIERFVRLIEASQSERGQVDEIVAAAGCENVIVRTVFKAIARYADMSEVVIMTKTLT